MEYVNWLAGSVLSLSQLYVTNLGNTYLEHRAGTDTVLIPSSEARAGIVAIHQLVAAGEFKVILPMSVQVFYYLCREKFIDEDTDLIQTFIRGRNRKQPKLNKAFMPHLESHLSSPSVGKDFTMGRFPSCPWCISNNGR